MTVFYENEKKKYKCIKLNNYTYNLYVNDIFIGQLRNMYVGRYLHWNYCPPPFSMIGEFTLTNGIIKEIVHTIASLYKKGKLRR
jgi:hypothetical protein